MDIDTDLRFDVREILLIYLKKRYGDNAISQILTKSLLQGKSAIDKVAMIFGRRDETDYRYIADKLKRKPIDFALSLKDEENVAALNENVDSEIEQEIIDYAVLMDGNVDHTGLHAAGVIISDNDDLMSRIPLAWDEGTNLWKTQCDMIQAEDHGLLKMDLLLLKTLDIITYTMRLIEKKDPEFGRKWDIENLPIEEDVLREIYAKGRTKSVFQFESPGMVKYLRQLQPKSIHDIIAMNALYRPGPLDSIPDYIDYAHHPEDIQYDCPQLEPILKSTYGQIVYQEQVMQIVRDLAGYSLGQSDLVRRAMAKKHEDELLRERESFIHGDVERGIKGCVKNGVSEEAANRIFDKMIAFASYAFNLAHACVYSLTSYITAWLKYHYTTEFECAVLNYSTKQEDLPSIFADCQDFGIEILPPDINKSEMNFSVEEEGKIRFGLSFLRGVKNGAEPIVKNRNGLYLSLHDFIRRSNARDTIMRACIESGAADCLITSGALFRKDIMKAYEKCYGLYDEMSDLSGKIEAQEGKDPAKAKIYEDVLKQKAAEFNRTGIEVSSPSTSSERLKREYYFTSHYFSGNPLDDYDISGFERSSRVHVTNIADLEENQTAYIVAAMFGEEEKKTKRGEYMLIAELSDRSDSISAVVFPEAYKKISPMLTEEVLCYKGRKVRKGEEEEVQFVVDDVMKVQKAEGDVVIQANNKQEFQQIMTSCAGARQMSGLNVRIFYLPDGKVYNRKQKVSEAFVQQKGWKYFVTRH